MEHIFSCTLCGSFIFNKRHDRVVTALLKVLRFHGISVSKPRANEFPLPLHCIEGAFDGVASRRTSKSLRDAKQSHFAADAWVLSLHSYL